MDICEECPMRLFNTKHYNLQGVGNPYYGKCIVVPNVDYIAYKKGDMGFSKQVEIIHDCLSSTGEVDSIYILPLIRCNKDISCELNENIYNRCMQHFAKDVKKYDFKYILLLGEVSNIFFNCSISINDNLNNIFISRKNNRIYGINYSPFIKYKDNNKFELFKTYILKWFKSINEYNFSQYNRFII